MLGAGTPETNILHLKIGLPKREFIFQPSICQVIVCEGWVNDVHKRFSYKRPQVELVLCVGGVHIETQIVF